MGAIMAMEIGKQFVCILIGELDAGLVEVPHERCFSGVLADHNLMCAAIVRGIEELIVVRIVEQSMYVNTGFMREDGVADDRLVGSNGAT